MEDIYSRIDQFLFDSETSCSERFKEYNIICVTHRACVELSLAMHTNEDHNIEIGFCGLVALFN